MKRKFLTLAIVALTLCSAQVLSAQTRTRTLTQPAAALLNSLPDSDAVAQVKLRQLLNEALPQMFANNPERLAEINASIESFKTRTGLDPRMFDQVALGARFNYPGEGVTKVQTVALANGSFTPQAMIAAGRIATSGNYREEKYQGKTIYIFKLDQDIRLLGFFDFRINELAATPLDASVLALGDVAGVRAVIDVGRASKRANAELIALASRDPNAVIGFGANLSEQLINNLDINPAIASDLRTLRQIYGSVSTTPKDLQLFLAARAVNADAAKNLGDTLEGLKGLGSLFVGRLKGAKGVLAKSALANLQIVTAANELQIRTAVPQADVGPLMGK